MSISFRNDSDVDRALDSLGCDLLASKSHLRLYLDLTLAISKYQYAMNHSPVYWTMTLRAQLDSALLILSRVYDKNPKTLNLNDFLSAVSKNLPLFSESRFRLRLHDNKCLDSLAAKNRVPTRERIAADLLATGQRSKLVKTLIVWRNNAIAHTSTQNVMDAKNISDDYPLDIAEIEELIKTGLDIVNYYSDLFRASTLHTEMLGQMDYQFVLDGIELNLEKCLAGRTRRGPANKLHD